MSLENILEFIRNRDYDHEVIYTTQKIEMIKICPDIKDEKGNILICEITIEHRKEKFLLEFCHNFTESAMIYNLTFEELKTQLIKFENDSELKETIANMEKRRKEEAVKLGLKF